MNQLEAKFARERKAKPSHWIIVPNDGYGWLLKYVGPVR